MPTSTFLAVKLYGVSCTGRTFSGRTIRYTVYHLPYYNTWLKLIKAGLRNFTFKWGTLQEEVMKVRKR